MQGLTVFLLYFLAFALCLLVLKQGLSQSVNLLSARNLYLLGFIVYQLANPASALHTGNFTFFQVDSPTQTGKIYLLYAYLFIGVFLLSYHKFTLSRWFARKFPAPQREISDSSFLGLAIALIVLAIPMRFYAHHIPGVGLASTQTSIAMVAVATGISGWVWGNRRLNLVVIALMILILGASFAIGMSGAFGRRPLIGILLGLAWGAYYRNIHTLKPAKLLLMSSPLLILAIVAVSAFTAIRHNRETSVARVQDTARNMASANITAGILDIFGGQTTGSASLWAIEQWPDRFECKPLYSLQFMAYWYVPRYLWPDKPRPLSKEIATLARIDYLNRDMITIPPGVIGYAVAEGGILVVMIYALFFGQFLRFIDELIRINSLNPFIILPAGCATGQMLGLARGDLAIFTNLIVLGFLTTFVLLFVASKLLGRKIQPAYWNQWPQSG